MRRVIAYTDDMQTATNNHQLTQHMALLQSLRCHSENLIFAPLLRTGVCVVISNGMAEM